ncbi:MAG: sigma-54 dependent transcriptional regulator [Pseudomonadota bacterium]
MAVPLILVVDDDESVVASLRLALKQAGFRSISAGGPDDALAAIEQQSPDLLIQDMNFSRETTGEEGLDLLAEIRRRRPALPVILLTAWGSIELAVAGMRLGAANFLTKPWDNAHLLQAVRTALSLASRANDADLTREQLDGAGDYAAIVGNHPALLRVLSTIARVAGTDASVLILGESGTGKELIADALHRNSERASGPLVKVNLAGVPQNLFESEMFGHVRGAFTDAHADREGRFEAAAGGTIFLDEVGDVDRPSQVKLLRVLQDRSYQPVGSSQTRTADVRVVSATNRDLEALVASGEFREDLLYRLNLITVTLPPLRDRRSDIPLIATAVLAELADRYGRSEAALSPDALAWLERQDWPGNVRQLRQAVERAVLMASGPEIGRDAFEAPGSAESDSGTFEGMTLDEVERTLIQRSLLQHEGNVSRAAQALGLSRAALYRRLEKFGLSSAGQE